MARDTEIYMLNREKAKEKLYPLLTENAKAIKKVINRRNDLFERYNQPEDKVSFDELLPKVKNDINTISPTELFEIERWIHEDYSQKNAGYKTDMYNAYLNELGIEKVLGLRRDDAYSYIWQLANYEDEFPLIKTGAGSDSSYNIKGTDFIGFLDYLILLMGKLAELDLLGYWPFETSYSKDQVATLKEVRAATKNEAALNHLVDSEVNYIISSWNYFMNGPNGRDDKKSGPESNTVWVASHFFIQSIYMRSSLMTGNSHVVICDSI